MDEAGTPERGGAQPENRALVEAMDAVAAHDTPERRALLFRLLLSSTVLAITPDQPAEPRTFTLTQNVPLRLLTFTDADGIALPVFTDPDAVLRAFPEGAGYVGLPARTLFQMAVDNRTAKIAVNPGSPTGGYLTRTEFEALAHGRLPIGGSEVVAEPTPVRIGQPQTPPPPEVVAVLREAMTGEPLVERAWYFLLQQEEQRPELSIAVQLSDGVPPEEERQAVRGILSFAGERSSAVHGYLFQVADTDLQRTLASGAGVEFYRRES